MLFGAVGWIFVKLVRYPISERALVFDRPLRMISEYQVPTSHSFMFPVKMLASRPAVPLKRRSEFQETRKRSDEARCGSWPFRPLKKK
ncbi:MAG: hypothetical protein CMQ45_07160 [Gammaproteobacteria bacterium]|nr:hypothetical protein [Gammaproteobacteria bacterium]